MRLVLGRLDWQLVDQTGSWQIRLLVGRLGCVVGRLGCVVGRLDCGPWQVRLWSLVDQTVVVGRLDCGLWQTRLWSLVDQTVVVGRLDFNYYI